MEERIRKFDTEEGISKKSLTQGEMLERVMADYKRYESKRSKFGNVLLDDNLIRFDFSIPSPLAKFLKSDAERKLNMIQRESDRWEEERMNQQGKNYND